MDNGQLRNPFGMIIKRQNMSENKWNHFKIVPQGHCLHNHCQLSIVNCQFGEAAKFLFILLLNLVLFSNLFFFLLRRAAAVLAQPGQKMLGHGGPVGKQEGAVPEHGVAVPACPAVIGDAQGEHVPRFYVPSLPPQEQTRLPWGRRTACRGCP